MRLLHTSTVVLHEFFGSVPKYAILSHTWQEGEVSLQGLQKGGAELEALQGYHKIRACCALAAREGWQYVWIDTCCIDKTSSAELSEAINSMFRWYQDAEVCYAYLADVRIDSQVMLGPSMETQFCNSRWFTRGWTLQEFLSPKNLTFYDTDWREYGTKSSLGYVNSGRSLLSLEDMIQTA